VRVTDPDRVCYSAGGETKLDVVNYYLSSATASSGRCGSGPACCTASRRAPTARRCTSSGCCPRVRRRGWRPSRSAFRPVAGRPAAPGRQASLACDRGAGVGSTSGSGRPGPGRSSSPPTPRLEARVRDIVGLYLDPSAKAICAAYRRDVADPGPSPARPSGARTTASGTAPPPCSPPSRSRPAGSSTPATTGSATRSSYVLKQVAKAYPRRSGRERRSGRSWGAGHSRCRRGGVGA